MKFILLGAGSIGQRHLQNLIGLGHQPVAVFDPDPARLQEVRGRTSTAILTANETEALDQKGDAVLICSPTLHHLRQAIESVRRGFHVFIEKPISHMLEGTEVLETEASKSGRAVLVACNLRFFQSLQLVQRLLKEGRAGEPLSIRAHYGYYLPFWRSSDYRLGYGAKREGGGIILDCIHEFDYLRWLLGEVTEVFCFAAKLSTLEIESEDTADILFRFSSGANGNLHLDYLQRTYRRSCEIIGEEGLIVWDYISQFVTLYGKQDRRMEVFQESINNERNQMFIDEMKHFIACVRGESQPLLNASGGRALLNIALAARTSASEGRVVKL